MIIQATVYYKTAISTPYLLKTTFDRIMSAVARMTQRLAVQTVQQRNKSIWNTVTKEATRSETWPFIGTGVQLDFLALFLVELCASILHLIISVLCRDIFFETSPFPRRSWDGHHRIHRVGRDSLFHQRVR